MTLSNYLGDFGDVHGHGGENDADRDARQHPSSVEGVQTGNETDHGPRNDGQDHAQENGVFSAKPVQHLSGHQGPDSRAQRDQRTHPAGFVLRDGYVGNPVAFLQLAEGGRRPRKCTTGGKRAHVHCKS